MNTNFTLSNDYAFFEHRGSHGSFITIYETDTDNIYNTLTTLTETLAYLNPDLKDQAYLSDYDPLSNWHIEITQEEIDKLEFCDFNVEDTIFGEVVEHKKYVVLRALQYVATEWVSHEPAENIIRNFSTIDPGGCCTFMPYKIATNMVFWEHHFNTLGWGTIRLPLDNSRESLKRYPVRGWLKKYSRAFISAVLFTMKRYIAEL